MAEMPFGYTHREKRSHAQMEGVERSTSPTWAFPTRRPSLSFHSTRFSHSDEHRAPASRSRASTPRDPLRPLSGTQQSHRPSSNTSFHPQSSRLHLPRPADMATSAPRRFPGDGFDYRRPAGSTRGQRHDSNTPIDLSMQDEDAPIDLSRESDEDAPGEHDDDGIIDLTADDSGYGASLDDSRTTSQPNSEERQSEHSVPRRRANNAPGRLPRGMVGIIDLDNGDEQWTTTGGDVGPGSPEIEFISSRPIDRPRRVRNPEEEEVEFVRENTLPEEEIRRRRIQEIDNVFGGVGGVAHGRFAHLRAQVDRFNAHFARTVQFRRPPAIPPRGATAHIRVGAFAAPMLDFSEVAFDLGIHRGRAAEPPPPPTYDAPEKAPEGFTRSPGEDDVLLCPNCMDELCVGDDELKRQVWLVKGCGHVYCGECTKNRSAKRSAKGKERPTNTKPFKECQVVDCGRSVSHKKAMIQIFM